MEKEFVPYDRALRLKAIRFDEPCFGFYQKESAEIRPIMVDDNEQYLLTGYRTCKNSEIPEHYISAPTFSQVFRWFREKYQIFPEVLTDCTTEPKFVYTYNTFYGNPKDLTEQEWGWENNIGQYSELYRSYEEAELTCLTKLIEIVENDKTL
jgi:hypothetical protein